MQVSSALADGIRYFIEAASKSPLAAVVAFALLVAGLAYIYFGRGRAPKNDKLLTIRFVVFVMFSLFAAGGVLLIRSLPTGVALADMQTAKPIRVQSPREQQAGQAVKGMSTTGSIAAPEFGSQVRKARKYSGLTDYVHACEIYTAAFGSLPAAVLSQADRAVVSVETRECGNGRSQEAVERLDGIATKFMVD